MQQITGTTGLYHDNRPDQLDCNVILGFMATLHVSLAANILVVGSRCSMRRDGLMRPTVASRICFASAPTKCIEGRDND